MTRFNDRANNEMRPLEITLSRTKYAEGSCLIKCGETHVLCTASVEEKVPPFLRNTGKGWITAEYGMLPRATHTRMDREAARGKQSGRTQEIQRLIGRSLRAAIDLEKLGERQIKLDCDVLQADGGTRCASITGAYVALYMAIDGLLKQGLLTKNPIVQAVAAVSCGINIHGDALLDVDYAEDSTAETDANFIMTDAGGIIEVQGTAEGAAFTKDQLDALYDLADKGTKELFAAQRKALGL